MLDLFVAIHDHFVAHLDQMFVLGLLFGTITTYLAMDKAYQTDMRAMKKELRFCQRILAEHKIRY